MSAIIEWIKWAVESIAKLLKDTVFFLLGMLWGWLQSILQFIWDKVLTLVEFMVGLVDFQNEMFDMTLTWAGLPTQVIYVLNECALDVCLLILVAALTIRLLLNLIPGAFTRV